MNKKISVVVPMYNEQEVANEFYNQTTAVLKSIPYEYEIIIVNDGSRDKTLEIALELVKKDEHIKVINFSRNFGHQAAITAGIENATRRCNNYNRCRFARSTRNYKRLSKRMGKRL